MPNFPVLFWDTLGEWTPGFYSEQLLIYSEHGSGMVGKLVIEDMYLLHQTELVYLSPCCSTDLVIEPKIVHNATEVIPWHCMPEYITAIVVGP